MMIIDLNLLASLAGCIALLAVWLKFWKKSGLRGFLLALLGCLTIYAIYKSNGQFLGMLGNVLLIAALAALLALVTGLIHARRRRVHVYIPPEQRRSPGKVTRAVKVKAR